MTDYDRLWQINATISCKPWWFKAGYVLSCVILPVTPYYSLFDLAINLNVINHILFVDWLVSANQMKDWIQIMWLMLSAILDSGESTDVS